MHWRMIRAYRDFLRFKGTLRKRDGTIWIEWFDDRLGGEMRTMPIYHHMDNLYFDYGIFK
jgi:hypothetical protein